MNELNETLKYIDNAKKNYDFGIDSNKLEYLYDGLKKIKSELPSKEKLEKLNEVAIGLDTKYEALNGLLYYFDPLYVKIKHEIHDKEVKKIRKNNRQRRNLRQKSC